jgi:Threonine dehydrogenase and related Zn-dependent dehydrogenases
MRAIMIQAPGNVSVSTVPDPRPRAGEVLVKVGACGICGTDMHILAGHTPLAHYPLIPGHEFAGEVISVDGITTSSDEEGPIAVGDRVAVQPNLYCGHCEFCRSGHENLCRYYAALGVTTSGGLAQYVAVPLETVYKLPPDLSYRQAALVEPLACAVHGLHKLNPQSGDTFLIAGAGTMSLMLLQLAVRGGASRIVVVDRKAHRLARAEQFGATRTYTSFEAALKDEPLGFDCVVEATGAPDVVEKSFAAVKRGGKFLIFGVAPEEATVALSPFRIYNDEITVLGSMAVLFSFQPALDLLSVGAIDTAALLTSAFPLDDFQEALDAVRQGSGAKTQIIPNS